MGCLRQALCVDGDPLPLQLHSLPHFRELWRCEPGARWSYHYCKLLGCLALLFLGLAGGTLACWVGTNLSICCPGFLFLRSLPLLVEVGFVLCLAAVFSSSFCLSLCPFFPPFKSLCLIVVGFWMLNACIHSTSPESFSFSPPTPLALCSSDWPELVTILLPQPSKCWDNRLEKPWQALYLSHRWDWAHENMCGHFPHFPQWSPGLFCALFFLLTFSTPFLLFWFIVILNIFSMLLLR